MRYQGNIFSPIYNPLYGHPFLELGKLLANWVIP